jgi:hypothetical protein
MNLTKQNFCFCIFFLISSKLCYTVNINLFPVQDAKTAVAILKAAAPIVANVAEKGVVIAAKVQTGLTSIGTGLSTSIGIGLKTGLMYAGAGTGVGLTALAFYYGYCRYCDYCIQKEQLRIALRNATIRNNILIGTTATASGIGIGYAIYRLYKSIQEHIHQKKQERELFAAKSNLLNALATANHDDKGQFELPTSCTTHVCKLLELPGGNQALSTIVSAYRKPILQQAESSTAMLAQPN